VRAKRTPVDESAADERRTETWQRCIARKTGACDLVEGCLACGPIEQSLRAAGWTLARWPHLNGRGKP
jgi:hypothetical protein